MAIETEVKFRMTHETWQDIKSKYEHTHTVHHVEKQTNQYYNTANNELNDHLIGLRLRLLGDKSVLTIKRDTANGIKRQEIEEVYPGDTEKVPPDSPALNELLNEIGCTYDQIIPFVMLRAERTIYMLEENEIQVEVCFDDVTIIDVCREHKLYEVEFELISGSEDRLMQIVADFQAKYGERVEQSAISKLQYALELVSFKS